MGMIFAAPAAIVHVPYSLIDIILFNNGRVLELRSESVVLNKRVNMVLDGYD